MLLGGGEANAPFLNTSVADFDDFDWKVILEYPPSLKSPLASPLGLCVVRGVSVSAARVIFVLSQVPLSFGLSPTAEPLVDSLAGVCRIGDEVNSTGKIRLTDCLLRLGVSVGALGFGRLR